MVHEAKQVVDSLQTEVLGSDQIIDSLGLGKTRKSNLENLTLKVLKKLKQGGVGVNPKVETQLHLALLRHYTKVHRYLLSPTRVDSDGSASGDDDDDEYCDEEPPAKRTKITSSVAPPGRIKKGKDFWSAMDNALAKDLEKYGKDMKDAKWREFFNELVVEDTNDYGANKGHVLPPLPSTYTMKPATRPSNTLPPSSSPFTTSESVPDAGPSHTQAVSPFSATVAYQDLLTMVI
ncbi:hypothetical protein BU15DRAFT_81136 [Melanogaster broomeanus]|nr:hypothetical protein BU15DRAFT_81136 [Melanogaster broomeanus]